MKKFKQILVVFIGISVIGICLSYAQPKIPKKDIPTNINLDVRKNIEMLYSSDPVERGNAAHLLGKIGKEATTAVPFLEDILDDNSSLIWTKFLGSPAWMAQPGDKATSPGKEAALSMVKIEGERAIELLITGLKGKDWKVRANIAWAMEEIKDPMTVEVLITALKDNHWLVRENAGTALVNIKGVGALEPILVVLKDENWEVRKSSINTLEKIKDHKAVEALITALGDMNYEVREYATCVLRNIGSRGVTHLIEALKYKDPLVRENAALALWHMNIMDLDVKDNPELKSLIPALKNAVEPLIRTLEDKNPRVRENVAIALGDIKDPRAIVPLISLLKDENNRVRERAAHALEHITGKSFGEDFVEWQKWWKQDKE